MVMALPIFREIRKNFPGAELTLMVRPEHQGILYGYADRFTSPKNIKQLPRYLKKYDLVFNIEYSLPQGYRPAPIGPGKIIHIGTPDFRKKRHVYRNLLSGLELHGLDVDYSMAYIKFAPETSRAGREWFNLNLGNIRDRLLVAVNPGSGFPKKRWPNRNFIKVCQWLISEFDAHIIVLGGSARDKTACGLIDALPAKHVTPLLGVPIEIVANILKRLDLQIGNDSGPGHVAGAVGLPTVTIFGPTSAGYWRPIGRKAVVTRNVAPECLGGYDCAKKCKHQNCLKKIKTSYIADGILIGLNRHVGRHRKEALDKICVSPDFKIITNGTGKILSNARTGHSCLISSGWHHVRKVINAVHRTGTFSGTLELYPEDRKLLEMLLLHRILVSTGIRKAHRPL